MRNFLNTNFDKLLLFATMVMAVALVFLLRDHSTLSTWATRAFDTAEGALLGVLTGRALSRLGSSEGDKNGKDI